MQGLSRIVLLLATSASVAGAAPTQVRLSIMGDATTIGIAWTTVRGPVGQEVRFRAQSEGAAGERTARAHSTRIDGFGTVSEVTLTGLRPDTLYRYRVGSHAAGWSGPWTFRTAGAASLRVAVVGDSRAERYQGGKGASDTWVHLVSLIARRAPALVLHTGDIVHDGRELAQWAGHLTVTEPLSARVPVMYAMGNHDDGPGEGAAANFNRVLYQPRSDPAVGGSGTEDYAYFTVGPALFVVLSTATFTGARDRTRFAQQAAWLDGVLVRHPHHWKLVVLHHPIYTERLRFSHPPNEAGQNAALVPVFNRHRVDVVFQGHNHFYERWAPSRCAKGASPTPCPVAPGQRGTIYITTGGGGAFPILVAGGTGGMRRAVSSAHHVVMLELTRRTLRLEAVDAAGDVIDRLNRTRSSGASAGARM